jgi:hypothetical protein
MYIILELHINLWNPPSYKFLLQHPQVLSTPHSTKGRFSDSFTKHPHRVLPSPNNMAVSSSVLCSWWQHRTHLLLLCFRTPNSTIVPWPPRKINEGTSMTLAIGWDWDCWGDIQWSNENSANCRPVDISEESLQLGKRWNHSALTLGLQIQERQICFWTWGFFLNFIFIIFTFTYMHIHYFGQLLHSPPSSPNRFFLLVSDFVEDKT